LFVGPGTALWPEFVAPHDLDADVGSPPARERFVDASIARALTVEAHLGECPCGKRPLHETMSGVAERRVELLAFADAETVE
jgi:hypothetical protein